MQLSWWVLPLFLIPPGLHHTSLNTFCLALAPWSPQCHKTTLNYVRLLEHYTNICDYTGDITVVLPEWQCPLVAILKLEQYRPISILVSSYLSSHVRTWPTCCPSWDPQGPHAWCPDWSVETSYIWLADNWEAISSADWWKAGITFKEWRKSLMMVPDLSTCLTSLAPLANGNISNGNLRVLLKLSTKIRRKALLHSSNTSPPQWITHVQMMQDLSTGGCPYMPRWNPWWAHRMHLQPHWPMWFSLQWREGKEYTILLCPGPIWLRSCLQTPCPKVNSNNFWDAGIMQHTHCHLRQHECYGLTGSKTVNVIHCQKQQHQWQQPQQQKSHTASTAQDACSNCMKSHAPGRSSCPAKDSVCSGWGHTDQWQPCCSSSGGPQATKKPEGSEKKQGGCCHNHQQCDHRWTDVVDVGADHNSQLDEVNVAGVTLQHGHEWLGADPVYITIANIKTNMRTEAFTTVKMPADIGPNQLGKVHCKVDTSAGGNIMPSMCFRSYFQVNWTPMASQQACAPQSPDWQPTMEVPYPNLVPMTLPLSAGLAPVAHQGVSTPDGT